MPRAAPGLIALLACTVSSTAFAAPSCEDLMRQIKLDSFDERWDRIRDSADQLLAIQPPCAQRQQAAFLRARALDRGGQPEPALAAYSAFLREHCAGDSLDCDGARIDRLTLAGKLYQSKRLPEYLDILLDGMRDPGNSGVVAALTVANLDDQQVRARALPRLLRAYRSNDDDDVRNRVCLAVLKIDPAQAPCGQGRRDVTSGSDRPPQLISVEVFNKSEGRVEIRMNMPVALAEAFIKALPEEARSEMDKRGVDVQQIFQAVRTQAKGQIFFAETEDVRVRIWLQ